MSGYSSRGGGFNRSRGGDDYGQTNSYDMFVPAGDCGRIIGRAGGKIRELQEASGCRIKVSRDDEGDGTRRVELNGSDDNIQMAKDMIERILEQQSDDREYGGGGGYGGPSGSKDVMKVDSTYVGRIIGKGGSRVRELQDETGCRINVSRGGGSYGQTEVELVGSASQIQRARDAIEDVIRQSYN